MTCALDSNCREVCNPWPGVLESAPASCGYAGSFGNDLMLKDLGLAVEAAVRLGATAPLGELARTLYALNRQQGNGCLDFSRVVVAKRRHEHDGHTRTFEPAGRRHTVCFFIRAARRVPMSRNRPTS
jgi:hypothetical protein